MAAELMASQIAGYCNKMTLIDDQFLVFVVMLLLVLLCESMRANPSLCDRDLEIANKKF
jgi:hypothetical protein